MLFYLKFFYMILCVGSNLVIATHFRHNHHGRVKARSVSSDITKLPNDYRNSSSRIAIFEAKNHRRSARSMPVSNENRNLSMHNFDKISIISFSLFLTENPNFKQCKKFNLVTCKVRTAEMVMANLTYISFLFVESQTFSFQIGGT